jgi:Reverse transcriptase (RNA-dependent DNA polymerase)
VVRPTTIRLILTLAVSHNWPIQQLDVQNAFLHGDLSEEVYMTQPPGFTDSTKPDHVCFLKKSLYGLKQSPRAWFHKLSESLVAFGFISSNYDPSLFVARSNNKIALLLVYVDDIIITSNNEAFLQNCISHLQQQFALKDLGPLSYFLGIEVQTTPQGLHLSQTKYILDLLKRTNMLQANPFPTPMAQTNSLSLHDGDPFHDPYLYRSVVGALQYATVTRPDIAFAVNKVSQFMHSPTTVHWTAVKRILRFLVGSFSHGITIRPTNSFQVHAFSDSDWAGSVDDRKSTSGFCLFLGPNLISWSAKKQPTVSRSSTEAEYRCLATTCAEIFWLQNLLKELHFHLDQAPILWCDNIGATFLASNPQFHARTKHVEIDYHFVRERVCSKEIRVHYICSRDQIGDIMTKPLGTPRFQFLQPKLTVAAAPLSLRGGNKTKNANSSDHSKAPQKIQSKTTNQLGS